MLQSLMAERFGLKVHTEDRPGNAYTLLPGTPKMKKADPANRASCTEQGPAGGEGPARGEPDGDAVYALHQRDDGPVCPRAEGVFGRHHQDAGAE
jgi:uncharacterized protein (TIGR03435 family)